MRTVYLNPAGADYPGPHAPGERRRRLAGHLNARLGEYLGEGVEQVAVEEGDVVCARLSGYTGAQGAQALAHHQVYCQGDGAWVRFVLSAATTFEDLDYVQGAVAQLLE